jgi:hypothetical protein
MSAPVPPTTSPEEPKEVYLEADKEIPGQHYVALSFLSPNSVLDNKNIHFFSEFLKDYEVQHKIKSTETFVMAQVAALQAAFSSVQDRIVELQSRTGPFETSDLSGVATIIGDFRKTLTSDAVKALEDHVKANMVDFKKGTIQEAYDTFMYKNKKKMEDDFFAANSFRTTVQGLKVRGVFDTYGEAVNRAKTLQKLDPSFNVYVGQVGFWLPWDPDPHTVADQEYADDQLNTLMKKYKENEATRDELYAQDKVSRMGNAKPKASTGPVGTAGKSTGAIGGADASTEATPTAMFGDEDLVLRRKRERKEEEEKAKAVESAAEKVAEKVAEKIENKLTHL